jgi:hypothetical protein
MLMVSETSLGATIYKSWGCLVASAIATFMCWVLWSCLEFWDVKQGDKLLKVLLPMLFTYCFLLGYLDFHPTGKKLGMSIVALNLLTPPSLSPELTTTKVCWFWLSDVLLGIAVSLVGLLFPYPQLASTRFEGRARFSASTTASLLEAIVIAWQRQDYYVKEEEDEDVEEAARQALEEEKKREVLGRRTEIHAISKTLSYAEVCRIYVHR